MKTKRFFLLLIPLFFSAAGISPVFCGTVHENSVFFTMSQHGVLNEASSAESAPSPIKLALGSGFSLPFSSYFSFDPYISFYFDYYLWALERALPSEIENRTALTPHMLLDFPLNVRFSGSAHTFTAGIGIAVLLRYAFAATGTSDSDAANISSINSYYWQDLHFLYPSLNVGWTMKSPEKWNFGIETRAYYPVANFVESSPVSALHGAMMSVSVRVGFPLKKNDYLRETAKE